MKKLPVNIIFVFFFIQIGYSQAKQKLNLDFEQNEKTYPIKWANFGNKDYKIYSDSTNVKSGKFSVVIENDGDISDYKALSFDLPGNYDGKSIRLTGFIKTENVTGGYAGLWMRIDPQIAFDNMGNRGITGTTDWKEYEITLPLNPTKTDKILIGGLLVGKGKMWLDNLKITIDGKDLDDKKIKLYYRETFPAEKDKGFDNGSKITFPV